MRTVFDWQVVDLELRVSCIDAVYHSLVDAEEGLFTGDDLEVDPRCCREAAHSQYPLSRLRTLPHVLPRPHESLNHLPGILNG